MRKSTIPAKNSDLDHQEPRQLFGLTCKYSLVEDGVGKFGRFGEKGGRAQTLASSRNRYGDVSRFANAPHRKKRLCTHDPQPKRQSVRDPIFSGST
jgi:hypothetical protein